MKTTIGVTGIALCLCAIVWAKPLLGQAVWPTKEYFNERATKIKACVQITEKLIGLSSSQLIQKCSDPSWSTQTVTANGKSELWAYGLTLGRDTQALMHVKLTGDSVTSVDVFH
jgi:hypothetical protein